MKKALKIMVSALVLGCICSLFAATSVSAKEYYGNDNKGYYWVLDDINHTITYYNGHYEGAETEFFDISSIKHLVLPDEINDFRDFNYFPTLDSVTFGKGISILKDQYTEWRCFCPYDVKEFIVADDHPNLAVYDGALYSKDYEVLYACPSLKDTLKIHPNCKVFAASRSVAKSFTLDPSNQYFSVYDGALYSKDYTRLIEIPRQKDTLKLHPNVREIAAVHRPQKAYELDASNPVYAVYDGMLYSKDFKKLYICPTGKKTMAFHPDLKTVCSDAIQSGLFSTIVLPEGTTTLEVHAIGGCENNVVVPDTLINFESDRDSNCITGRGRVLHSARNTAAASAGLHTQVLSDAEYRSYYTEGYVNQTGYWDHSNDPTVYYRYEDDTYATGWAKIGNDWYYFDSKFGTLYTGFQRIDGKAYYLGTTGAREHDKWKLIGNDWYYLNSYGAGAVKCWLKSGNKWYFMQADGSMARSKWIKWYNKWYYVGSDGAMYANRWIKSSGKWYYLGSDGAMYANRYTPDGYWVNSSGVWVK